jgi:trk system potassium uptake protein TrkH
MGIGEALTEATFNLVSIVTTTGYASTDYLLWGTFPVALFFLVTLLGGCTGSTSGGIKTFRLVLLWKVFSRQIRALRFPDGAFPIRVGDRPVSEAVALSALAFVVLYLSTMLVITAAVCFTGLDLVTSLSGVAQALGNVGPGLGPIIGPAGNFSSLPDAAKWLLAAAMIVGRLEIGAAFVVLAPAFWRV